LISFDNFAFDKATIPPNNPLSSPVRWQSGGNFRRQQLTLNTEQRAELEALGPATVRAKLIQPGAGRGAALSGFKTGIFGGQLTRGDVEDWLAEKHIEETRIQHGTFRWARIAGWTGIVGIIGLLIDHLSLIDKLIEYLRHLTQR